MTRLVSLLAALVLLLAAPASAGTGTVRDPAGDGTDGLDVRTVGIDNGADRLVVTVAFTEVVRGALIVSVAPRRGEGVRLISKYRPFGPPRSFVLPGAFGKVVGRDRGICDGFRATWDEDAGTARLTMPSRCLAGGDYGDLRFGVLTEKESGDTDLAPEDLRTRWIGRG